MINTTNLNIRANRHQTLIAEAPEQLKEKIVENAKIVLENLAKLMISGDEQSSKTELHSIVNSYLDVLYSESINMQEHKNFEQIINDLFISSSNLIDNFCNETLEKFSESVTSWDTLFQLSKIFEGGGLMLKKEIFENNPLDNITLNYINSACKTYVSLKRHYYIKTKVTID